MGSGVEQDQRLCKDKLLSDQSLSGLITCCSLSVEVTELLSSVEMV